MSTEPVRVGFVMHLMQVAGAEVLVSDLIHRLAARISPVVFCLDGIGQLGEQLRAEGIPVMALGRRPGLDIGVANRLAHEIRAHRIEVIHAHQYTPFFYSALAKLRTRRRTHLIFTEHGRHYPDNVSRKRRLINRLFLSRLADDVTAVCRFSAKSLAVIDGFNNVPIAIIENGIDTFVHEAEPREVLRARLGLDCNRRYIVCVARFHPVKDHATLLQAFALVAPCHSDTDLLLAGDGPLRNELQNQARALGLSQRVSFLGIRHDVPALLHAADVFAMTSVSEAASLTLLEAMAASLPVVVTDVGGNPEIARSGKDGILVSKGDVNGVAEALRMLLRDRNGASAMGMAGRHRVLTHYRLEATVDRYYERYRKAQMAVRRASGTRRERAELTRSRT